MAFMEWIPRYWLFECETRIAHNDYFVWYASRYSSSIIFARCGCLLVANIIIQSIPICAAGTWLRSDTAILPSLMFIELRFVDHDASSHGYRQTIHALFRQG